MDQDSTKSIKKEFTLNKSRSIEKRDRTPLGKAGRNNISNVSLNLTNHSNSKRKRSKQENIVKKLESEIEKDTINFSNLSLEKRWRMIN
jgi:hypothetical protein